jgi:hypothetical protein
MVLSGGAWPRGPEKIAALRRMRAAPAKGRPQFFSVGCAFFVRSRAATNFCACRLQTCKPAKAQLEKRKPIKTKRVSPRLPGGVEIEKQTYSRKPGVAVSPASAVPGLKLVRPARRCSEAGKGSPEAARHWEPDTQIYGRKRRANFERPPGIEVASGEYHQPCEIASLFVTASIAGVDTVFCEGNRFIEATRPA